jgi:hypothetical protein
MYQLFQHYFSLSWNISIWLESSRNIKSRYCHRYGCIRQCLRGNRVWFKVYKVIRGLKREKKVSMAKWWISWISKENIHGEPWGLSSTSSCGWESWKHMGRRKWAWPSAESLEYLKRTFALSLGDYPPYLHVARRHMAEEALPWRTLMIRCGGCEDVGHMGYPFRVLRCMSNRGSTEIHPTSVELFNLDLPKCCVPMYNSSIMGFPQISSAYGAY